ncbi:MAG: DUF1538 domain-containing protein [Clostridia bacterium]|nr:DUF1538 domain-containing protein [Clostridia bacterium]
MRKLLKAKISESVSAVLPITVIVVVLSIALGLSTPILTLFLIGACMLILGMGLFTLGADMSMIVIGDKIGSTLTKSRSLPLISFVTLLIGVFVTIAEPDLTVLAEQVSPANPFLITGTVALGVGIFLVIAVLRTFLRVKLSYLLVFFYAIVFVLAAFTSKDYLALAFDSGGVTTGVITVPFILALNKGFSAVRADKDSGEDSFGMVALASVGPILAVLILGIFSDTPPDASVSEAISDTMVNNSRDLFGLFGHALPDYAIEVAVALLPIVVLFLIFQFVKIRMSGSELIKIFVGLLYTYAGLVIFLTGVNVGFLPVGNLVGEELAVQPYNWILIPLGLLIGYFIVSAEPAVHVLNNQVEEITGGVVSRHAMMVCMSVGVAVSVSLAMVRVLTGMSIWWLIIPGYLTALLLTFVVPPIFTGIAFDSGGVASGPMTATFLLPLAMGACDALPNGNILTDAFGVVAMVAMTPLIAIQIMGLMYKIKMAKAERVKPGADSCEIIELSLT